MRGTRVSVLREAPQAGRGAVAAARPLSQQTGARSTTRRLVRQMTARGTSLATNGPAAEVQPSSKLAMEAWRTGLATAQGPRETMEDAAHVALYAPCGFLYASVFDGHGGSSAVTYLQQQLYNIFVRILNEASNNPELVGDISASGLTCPLGLSSVLKDTYERADQELLQWLSEHAVGSEKYSGCTATTVLLGHERVIVANLGDSRAVLCRAGSAIDLTVEHRVYGSGSAVLSETERIESVGGWVDDGRVCGMLAVSRAFGDAEFKGDMCFLQRGVRDGFWDAGFAASRQLTGDPVSADAEVTEIALQDDDEFVVLATDGLWDVISSQEVCRIVKTSLGKGQTPQEVATKLCDFACKRYTQDNVAAVVIELKQLTAAAGSGGGSTKKRGGLFGGLFR